MDRVKNRVKIPIDIRSLDYQLSYLNSECMRILRSITSPENIIKSTPPQYRDRVRKQIAYLNSLTYEQQVKEFEKSISLLPIREQLEHRFFFNMVEKYRQLRKQHINKHIKKHSVSLK